MLLRPDIALADGGGGISAPKKTGGSAVSSSQQSALSKQFANISPTSKTTSIGGISIPTASTQTSYMPNNMSISGPTGTKNKVNLPSKDTVKTVASDLLFGTESFKAGAHNLGAAVTGKDTSGKSLSPVGRLKSFGAGIGDVALGALNLGTTAAMVIPGGGQVAKSADIALNTAIKGSKAISTHAAGKAASTIAATTLALSPATHVAAAAKPTTTITKTINADKKAAAAADTFVPKTASTTAKNTASKVSADVVNPNTVAAGVKEGTGLKVAKTVSAATKVGEFKTGTTDHTKVDAKKQANTKADTKKDVKDIVTSVKTATAYKDIKDNQNKKDKADDQAKGKADDKAKGNKGSGVKVSDGKDTPNINQGDIWNADDPFMKPHKYDINIKSEVENVNNGGGKKTEEPPPREVPAPPLPLKISSDVEEFNRKRKWNPSAIV